MDGEFRLKSYIKLVKKNASGQKKKTKTKTLLD